MQMIEVKAADLAGLALDWAVAKVEGISTHKRQEKTFALFGSLAIPLGDAENGYAPSSCWHCGGPLIEKYKPDLETKGSGEQVAYLNNNLGDPDPLIAARGDTYLVALCRAIVAAKLGEVVSLPAELVSQ